MNGDAHPYTWAALCARLEQIGASCASGAAILQVTVLTEDGRPCFWTSPRVIRVEPKAVGRAFVQAVAGSDPASPDS